MVLIDSIKKSFVCVVNNPAITLFLVLFLIAFNILFSLVATSNVRILGLVLMLCLLALIFVFFSGWYKVIKESTDVEKIKDKNFYALFLEGVGEHIIPCSTGLIICTLCIPVVIFLTQYIATIIFGDISFFINDVNQMMLEPDSFVDYLNNLDIEHKKIIGGWYFCVMLSLAIFNFISLFYFTSVFASEDNIFLRPITAFWKSLVFLFKNFFSVLGLMIFVGALLLLIVYCNAVFAHNRILSVLLLLVNLYFISYVVMLVFNYYETKNNSSDRPDGIGENEDVDSSCEEN